MLMETVFVVVGEGTVIAGKVNVKSRWTRLASTFGEAGLVAP